MPEVKRIFYGAITATSETVADRAQTLEVPLEELASELALQDDPGKEAGCLCCKLALEDALRAVTEVADKPLKSEVRIVGVAAPTRLADFILKRLDMSS